MISLQKTLSEVWDNWHNSVANEQIKADFIKPTYNSVSRRKLLSFLVILFSQRHSLKFCFIVHLNRN